LVELLVAMAVGGVVLGVLVCSIFQIGFGSGQITKENTAQADIDCCIHWITRDIVMGQTINLIPGAPPTANVTMSWNDLTAWAVQDEEISHSVTYTYSGTELQRNYNGVVTTIGRYLTDVGFSVDGRLVTITLASSLDGEPRSTVTRRYVIQMRTEPGF